MADKRSVAVTIAGQEYKIRSDRDPAAVKRAAQLLDDTMARVRQRAGTADTVDVAVLAALNLANQLVALRDGAERGSSVDDARLDDLLATVESAFAEATA